MKKYITLLPLCAAMALTMPVSGYAQTAATETPAATDAPETTAPTAEAAPATEENTTTGSSTDVQSQLSLGEDSDGEPTLGKPYTKEVIGAWEMRGCCTVGNGPALANDTDRRWGQSPPLSFRVL